MKGILIDPVNRTITNCSVENETFLDDLYKLIFGPDYGKVMMIVERVNLPYHQLESARSPDDLWLDECGFLHDENSHFTYGGMILAGRAVILGANEDHSESCDTLLSIEHVRALVRWA